MLFRSGLRQHHRRAGEPGLAGATLVLTQAGVGRYTATSAAGGGYLFAEVAASAYTLVEVSPPPGYQPYPHAIILAVAAGETVTLDLGHRPIATPTPSPTPTARPIYRYLPLVRSQGLARR